MTRWKHVTISALLVATAMLGFACKDGGSAEGAGTGGGEEPVVGEPGGSDPSGERPLAATGEPCGGMAGVRCADGEFCDIPVSAMCGAADGMGVCREIPTMCTREYRPVCGCNEQTYPNACSAAAAGVSVASPRACGEGDAPATGGVGPRGGECVRMGCAQEICHDSGEPMESACVERPEHACYTSAICERLPSGECGFRPTDELAACLADPSIATRPRTR